MHPFLPKLKSSTDSDKTMKLAAFDRRGFWRTGGNIDLSELSNSLEIDTIDPNYIEVDSVPDMWARPILFEMAFFNKNHLLHKRFIEEWRGLLAMLALKEIRNLQIDAAEVRIPRRDQQILQNEEEKKLAETAPDFIQALADLAPKDFIAEDSDWHRLYVILFRGRPIGMTSPTTLVCTAVNYMNRIFDDVKWFNGRLLEDPAPYLNDYEKMSLVSWLEKLKDNLSNHAVRRENQFMRNDIIKEIDSFQHTLGRGERIDPARLSGTGLHLEHGIFAYLDRPVKQQEESPEVSHVKLQSSRTNPEPSTSILVIDRDIAKQWNIPEQDVVVIGSTTLSSTPYSGLGADRTRFGEKTLRGAEWRKPEMFFTRKLFYVAEKNAFPGSFEVDGMRDLSFKGQPITPILPIQPWLLQYLTLQDLRRRFTFEKTNDGIMARLILPLRGKDGNSKDFTIKKEYRNADNELQVLKQLPVMEVWPNFKANNWKAYYTYYAREKYSDTFYATPVAPGAQLESQTSKHIECETPNVGMRLEKITRLDGFPEAFECFVDLPTTGLDKFETIPAGLILLQQPKAVRQTDDWKIGIDFGTTGTNVFYAKGDGEPQPFKFDDHFFQVTNSQAEFRTDTIYYRFVAGKKNAITPFLTIYHDFRIANPVAPILRPLLDGHIFFKSKDVEFDALKEGLYTNLKWGNTVEDRKRSGAFLTQLCLQCAAEAVHSGARFISWRYSFPTAFSPGETLYFQQAWTRIIDLCNNLTGVNTISTDVTEGTAEANAALGRDAETLKPLPKTESVAAGQFFADKPNIKTEAAFGNKGVCLDIGGGTSDISVWYDNELRWQASIRFAGREILLNLFYQNPSFLKLLEAGVSQSKNNDEIKFYAQLDVALKEKGDEWLKNLHIYTGEPIVKGFIQLMALALSGLTFYVGQTLSALNSDKKIKFPAEIPNLFIGGNGARMFDWLAGGSRFDNKSLIAGLFKAMLLTGSGFKTKETDFKICTSPEPKSEVAYGLVSDKTKLKGTDQLVPLGMIAGECFVEKGAEQPWQAKLTAERLNAGIEHPASVEQFRRFLDTFKSYTKSPNSRDIIKTIEDDEDVLRECRDVLAQNLAAAKSGKLDDVHVEPFFIIMLKHFLDVKTAQWAKSQKPV